ncbi:hypothetical protein [Halosimplex amylolyticum]|uniref:hypothetical protein n=1 Tax=Halosimplex amylolyticum TaxID=3396616 RepID=UPI003F54C4C6
MKSVHSGTGHLVVAATATSREATGPVGLPLAARFATAEASAALGPAAPDIDPLRGATATARVDPHPERGLSVVLEGSDGRSRRRRERQSATVPASAAESPTFVLGLHAASVGGGDPTSLESLVGTRALPPGRYRDGPVPVWKGNPFPIAHPDHAGERPRTRWSDVDLAPESDGRTDPELTATLWSGLDAATGSPLTPVTDVRDRPISSSATVTLENRTPRDGRGSTTGDGLRGR